MRGWYLDIRLPIFECHEAVKFLVIINYQSWYYVVIPQNELEAPSTNG